jgi:serine/threonine-protein kinase
MGVLLYEMTTGRPPFEGETPQDVLTLILEGRPLLPYRSEVTEMLEEIVTKALRKDKEDRYQTAKELRTDLESLKKRLEFEAEKQRHLSPDARGGSKRATNGGQKGAHKPTDSTSGASALHATSRAEYLVSEIKKHWRAATLALSVLLLALLGLGYWFFDSRAAGPAPILSIAVMPFINETDNDVEYLTDGMTESLIN